MPRIGHNTGSGNNIPGRIKRWASVLSSPPALTTRDSGLQQFADSSHARPLVMMRGEGTRYGMMPAQWARATAMCAPGSGATLTQWGGWTSIGTPANATPTTTTGDAHNMVTGATANNEGGVFYNRDAFWRANGFFYAYRCIFPTTLGTGATGSRVWLGMSDGTFVATNAAAADPGGHAVGFSFDTNRGDTNWMLSTKDNVTHTPVSTGVAFATGTMFDFFIYCPPSGTDNTVYWSVWSNNGVTSGSTTTTMPGTTTLLRPGAVIRTLTTTARDMYLVKMYCEAEA